MPMASLGFCAADKPTLCGWHPAAKSRREGLGWTRTHTLGAGLATSCLFCALKRGLGGVTFTEKTCRGGLKPPLLGALASLAGGLVLPASACCCCCGAARCACCCWGGAAALPRQLGQGHIGLGLLGGAGALNEGGRCRCPESAPGFRIFGIPSVFRSRRDWMVCWPAAAQELSRSSV